MPPRRGTTINGYTNAVAIEAATIVIVSVPAVDARPDSEHRSSTPKTRIRRVMYVAADGVAETALLSRDFLRCRDGDNQKQKRKPD